MKKYIQPGIKVREMIMEQAINAISGGSAEIDPGSGGGAGGAGAKMDMLQFILDNM